jgi:hypothetical protein
MIRNDYHLSFSTTRTKSVFPALGSMCGLLAVCVNASPTAGTVNPPDLHLLWYDAPAAKWEKALQPESSSPWHGLYRVMPVGK